MCRKPPRQRRPRSTWRWPSWRKVEIGYASGKGSAGYEGRIEAFGFPLFRTAGKLDASLSELAVDAELVDLRSPWIGIYIVNFRGSVNVHLRGNLSFNKFNVGAEGRAEIEGEVLLRRGRRASEASA